MLQRVLILSAILLLPTPVLAQRMTGTPVLFQDPMPNGTWQEGELVLGRTLLQSARRMFPDAPAVYDGPSFSPINQGNPQPVERHPFSWQIAGRTITPKYIFQLGPARWILYFDQNQRLVVASAPESRRTESTRADFARHYPTLREVMRGTNYFAMEAALQDCVVLTAVFLLPTEILTSYSYSYTCETQSGN